MMEFLYALFVLGLILILGILLSNKSDGHSGDFFLANGSITKWVGAFAASASAESGWVMLGLVGAAYSSGASVLWLIPGCVVGYTFNWFALAPKINDGTKKFRALTLPELIGHENNSEALRFVLAIAIFVLITSYLAAQFFAIGKTFSGITGINKDYCIGFGALFILTYVIWGGMRASFFTDLLQALLMVMMLIALPVYSAYQVFYSDIPINNLPDNFLSLTGGNLGFGLIGLIGGWAGIGLAYPGQPHIHQRFMSMKDSASMHSAGLVAILWSTLVFLGAITAGLVGRALINNPPDQELILLYLAKQLTNPFLTGMVIAAIFSAIASTADSQLLVISASLKNDISYIKQNRYLTPRLITLIVAVVAVVFAVLNTQTVFSLVLIAWEFLGVTVGIAVIGTFLIKRSSMQIFISMFLGVVSLLLWRYDKELSASLYALIPAMLVATAALLPKFSKKDS